MVGSSLPLVLTVAGSDPSGGAGLQADLKTFHQHHVFGLAVPTLLTVQNSSGVHQCWPLSATQVGEQVGALIDEFELSAVKLGALGRADVVLAVAQALARLEAKTAQVVFDPVAVSSSGARLTEEDATRVAVRELLPRCALVTPNLPEAAVLTGVDVGAGGASAERAAERLLELGARAVLITDGHGQGATVDDLLISPSERHVFSHPRIDSAHTHGTGCALSSAIAARLARGESLPEAAGQAIDWVSRAIESAPGVGHALNLFAPTT